MEYRIKSVQNGAQGYGFQAGPSKKRETTGNPQVILPRRSPVKANYRTHTHSYILEYWMKIVQNAALWTRLRFSGGAIKRRERRPETLR